MADVNLDDLPMGEAVLTEVAPSTRPRSLGARSESRTRYNKAMRLVRRAHLYAGLFMTPWVFLYGATALLFNHPDAFPDQEIRRFGSAELSGTALGSVPSAEALAARVVASLNTTSDGQAEPAYRLVRPDEASFGRELFATAQDEGRQFSVRIDLGSGEGSVRETIVRSSPDVVPAPFATLENPTTEPPPLADLQGALAAAMGRLGLPIDEVSTRSAPDLAFLMEGGGQTWQVRYDLASGAVAGRPEGGPGDPISTRRFLTRLHVAHGYPDRVNARWLWAVAVDAMFVSMVGWGITGLLMWWQMKNVRRAGALTLVLSAVVATTVAVGMHESLTSTFTGGGTGGGPVLKTSAGSRGMSPEGPVSEGRGDGPRRGLAAPEVKPRDTP